MNLSIVCFCASMNHCGSFEIKQDVVFNVYSDQMATNWKVLCIFNEVIKKTAVLY